MNKLHILGGALLFAVLGTGFAYIVGTGFLSFWRGYNGQYLDWLAIVRDLRWPALVFRVVEIEGPQTTSSDALAEQCG